jgi:hypothetical protein
MADLETDRLMSGAAWSEFCARLKTTGERILESDFPDDERSRTEGFRHLLRLLSYSTRLEIEAGDPLYPDFIRCGEPHSQWGGPNPDCIYLRAVIDPTETYKIWADVDGMHQANFCQHHGDGQLEPLDVLHPRTLDSLDVDDDGFLEVMLSPDRQDGNWIRAHPDARFFTIRIYVSDWEQHTAPTFHIERVGAEGVAPPPLAAADLALGLDRVAQWVEKSAIYWNDSLRTAFEASTPNVPSPAQTDPGDADALAYGRCFWELEQDEALVLTCDVPKADYWGFSMHTLTWFESGDHPRRQTSLSGDQLTLDDDGRVRLVVSKEDPGVPNWLDTEGRTRGLLAYRSISAESNPTPTAVVVAIDDVYEHLPDDHPHVTDEERRESLSVRRESLWNRCV